MKKMFFTKMHGLGNDFVVVDARKYSLNLTAEQICFIADRRLGIGCDQLIRLETPTNTKADIFMRIFNADGSESGACGNASRCIAAQIMTEDNKKTAVIETKAGILKALNLDDDQIAIDMGEARLNWNEIPLARNIDTLHLGISAEPLEDPTAVNVGNPHAVFFVSDLEAIPLTVCGPKIENHPIYPERTNVEVVQILARDCIRVKVWERGVGITKASGSCASAALVAAHRRGLTERKAEVILDGGSLIVEWKVNGHVVQIGPYAEVFSGNFPLENLGSKL